VSITRIVRSVTDRTILLHVQVAYLLNMQIIYELKRGVEGKGKCIVGSNYVNGLNAMLLQSKGLAD
jgi:hypothetical protein